MHKFRAIRYNAQKCSFLDEIFVHFAQAQKRLAWVGGEPLKRAKNHQYALMIFCEKGYIKIQLEIKIKGKGFHSKEFLLQLFQKYLPIRHDR